MLDRLGQLGAPAEVVAALGRLHDELTRAAGANLVGLILYGGLARGRYVAGRSDVNVVVLLREATGAALTAVAAPLHAAWRAARVEPFLLTPAELPGVAASFPTKLLDIKEHHLVLAGEDPFAGLEIPREHLRLRTAQELHNLTLRLRRRYLAIANNRAALAEALASVARPLALQLASLLRLAGHEPPADDRTAALLESAAAAFGFDREALAQVAALRRDLGTAADMPALYAGVLDVLARAAAIADRMKETPP